MKKVLTNQIYGNNHSYYYFEGDMTEIIHNLTKLYVEAQAAGFSNIRISWSSGYSSDDIEWCIRGDRIETDREYDARIKMEKRIAGQRKKDQLNREQQERKEYERLKKKFEKKK
jgi:hypothetical protein